MEITKKHTREILKVRATKIKEKIAFPKFKTIKEFHNVRKHFYFRSSGNHNAIVLKSFYEMFL